MSHGHRFSWRISTGNGGRLVPRETYLIYCEISQEKKFHLELTSHRTSVTLADELMYLVSKYNIKRFSLSSNAVSTDWNVDFADLNSSCSSRRCEESRREEKRKREGLRRYSLWETATDKTTDICFLGRPFRLPCVMVDKCPSGVVFAPPGQESEST